MRFEGKPEINFAILLYDNMQVGESLILSFSAG